MYSMNSYTLITGGSQGIGLSLARQFAQNGYNLILVARDPSELEEASAALSFYGVEIITIVKDLFNKDAEYMLAGCAYQVFPERYVAERERENIKPVIYCR